jgi:hypothetical protein
MLPDNVTANVSNTSRFFFIVASQAWCAVGTQVIVLPFDSTLEIFL